MSLVKRVRRGLDRLVYEPRTDPIIVLGNQKAGTSAVASLLADCGGLSKTIDVPEVWPLAQALMHGEADFSELVVRHPKPFSRELIKEPNLTFFYDAVRRAFPDARYVFVNRDPRTNTRSFLARCKLPGDLEHLDLDAHDVPKSWRWDFDPAAWGSDATHYVDLLAERWNRSTDVHLEHPDELLLLRYEDFLDDKAGTIERLACELGVEPRNDVSALVDVQYQPAGSRRSPREFFGDSNLARIERICGERMRAYGYEPELDA